MMVILVVFDRRSFELSGALVGRIDEYIDEHGVGLARLSEYKPGKDPLDRNHPGTNRRAAVAVAHAEGADRRFLVDVHRKSLDEVVDGAGDTFQQRLFKLIDLSGMDEVSVYKRANITRKLFSSIRCKPDYKPKKITAVAFAIALRLDMPTMLDLLARAGIALSPSDRFDLIVAYFVSNGIYDMGEINAALFDYGQPTIFTEA